MTTSRLTPEFVEHLLYSKLKDVEYDRKQNRIRYMLLGSKSYIKLQKVGDVYITGKQTVDTVSELESANNKLMFDAIYSRCLKNDISED
jgi:hypothetical protein